MLQKKISSGHSSKIGIVPAENQTNSCKLVKLQQLEMEHTNVFAKKSQKILMCLMLLIERSTNIVMFFEPIVESIVVSLDVRKIRSVTPRETFNVAYNSFCVLIILISEFHKSCYVVKNMLNSLHHTEGDIRFCK